MPWAVICDFCEAPAALPGDQAGMYGGLLPDGWLWLTLGTSRGHAMGEAAPEHRGLVCSGGCAVRLVARWQDELAAERRAKAEDAERRQRVQQEAIAHPYGKASGKVAAFVPADSPDAEHPYGEPLPDDAPQEEETP